MKNHRRSQRHSRRKAPPGAYSDRYGPRGVRQPAAAPAGSPDDPWLKDFPSVVTPPALILDGRRNHPGWR